jgi:hypothetical protein
MDHPYIKGLKKDGGAGNPTARPFPENQEMSRPVHVGGGNMARGDFRLEKELGGSLHPFGGGEFEGSERNGRQPAIHCWQYSHSMSFVNTFYSICDFFLIRGRISSQIRGISVGLY